MTAPDPSAPGCRFLVSAGEALVATVDLTLYSERALLATAHQFTHLVHAHLERQTPHSVVVRFQAKEPGKALDYLAGEFMNALLDQTLREKVQAETEGVRNLILAHALSQVSLLRPELETAEPFADPDGIGLPDAPPASRREG